MRGILTENPVLLVEDTTEDLISYFFLFSMFVSQSESDSPESSCKDYESLSKRFSSISGGS